MGGAVLRLDEAGGGRPPDQGCVWGGPRAGEGGGGAVSMLEGREVAQCWRGMVGRCPG